MNKFIGAIRILYTVTLILFGLVSLVFFMVSISASENGHAVFNILSFENTTILILLCSLLASRILFYISPKWLWLGAPTVVIIYGVLIYFVFNVMFLTSNL